MENAKSLFAERLRRAMGEAGLVARPAVLEREFNLHYKGKSMTLHGVRRWLAGEAMPAHDKIVTLATWLNVPVTEFYASGTPRHSVQEPRTRWGEEVGHREREIFAAFLKLPAAQQRLIREMILALLKAQG